jgi:nucleoside-diphosphate-sugar epimerase
MASYLVTGGGGFIGSNIAHALVARGERVRIFDNFSTGRRENIAELVAQKKVELIEGDVADEAAVARAVKGVDFVLHQAALASVPRSVTDPLATDRVNVHGTLVVLNEARKANVKRVVFAASSSAYGEQAEGVAKVETMSPAPISPYGVSKVAGEYYIRAFLATYGFEAVALRYFNVFGPRQDPTSQYAAVIPNFVTAALHGTPATIYGDGGQSRDFCFIDNVVEANVLACTAKDAGGDVFNIACGEAVTLLEVNKIIGEYAGNKVAPVHEPGRAGDIRHSLADISRAQKVLGYQPRVLVRQGLERTVAWYRQSL